MNSITVLHVEDNEDDALIVKKLLEKQKNTQFNITWVSNKYDALHELLINQHDILLLDEQLGNELGSDIAEEFFKRKIKIPIVFLTSFENHLLNTRLQNIGVYDLLNKGEITSNLLSRSINYTVAKSLLQQQEINNAIIDQVFGVFTKNSFLHIIDLTLKRHNYNNLNFLLVCFSFKNLDDLYTKHSFINALNSVKKPYDIIGRVAENRFIVIINECDYNSFSIIENAFRSIADVPFSIAGILIESGIMDGNGKLLKHCLTVLSEIENNSSPNTTESKLISLKEMLF